MAKQDHAKLVYTHSAEENLKTIWNLTSSFISSMFLPRYAGINKVDHNTSKHPCVPAILTIETIMDWNNFSSLGDFFFLAAGEGGGGDLPLWTATEMNDGGETLQLQARRNLWIQCWRRPFESTPPVKIATTTWTSGVELKVDVLFSVGFRTKSILGICSNSCWIEKWSVLSL